MTVSATNVREMTIGKLVTMGYQKAGLLSVYGTLTQQQVSSGVDELELILKGLNAKGLYARKVVWETITLATGVWQYALREGILDVVATGMYADPTQPVAQMDTPDVVATVPDVETPVRFAMRDEYQRLSAKSAQGRPILYFPERTGAVVILYFWPIPSVTESGGHVRLQAHEWRADSIDANATADVERFWEEHLVWQLAHNLVVNSALNLNRAGYLAGMAEKKLQEAKGMSFQSGDQRIRMVHRTGWRRR